VALKVDSRGITDLCNSSSEMDADVGEEWGLATSAYLSLNIITLLLVWFMARKINLEYISAWYDAATLIAFFAALNRHDLWSGFTNALLSLSLDLWKQDKVVTGILLALPVLVLGIRTMVRRKNLPLPLDSRLFEANPGLQPQLLPCRTSHTRLFPRKHSFSYSYLYTGIPVGWKGAAGTLLSADPSHGTLIAENVKSTTTWFSVEGSDYLQRSNSNDDLQEKLHSYLRTQAISLEEFPFAYLVTAPRFLGFSFNPVSFWYLYSNQKELTAMILEVNNTFDERRMYFLRKTGSQVLDAGAKDDFFMDAWQKDFHVSPFNDRDGCYSVTANDPLAPQLSAAGCIDNTISLSSADGKPKLVARVFSVQPPVLAFGVATLPTLRFVCKWWWVGFMTNFRILREARKLWSKNLRVYYRPEVKGTSLGRRATAEEDILAGQFLSFLRYIQGCSIGSHCIRYTAAAGKHRGNCILVSPAASPGNTESNQDNILDLQVLTPAFYSSFVGYSDALEAFNRLCRCELESERVAYISDHEKFEGLLTAASFPSLQFSSSAVLRRCTSLHALRSSHLMTAFAILALDGTGIRTSVVPSQRPQLSDMDVTALSPNSNGHDYDRQEYLKTVIRVLLAKRFACGSMFLLRLFVTAFRFFLFWLAACRVNGIVPNVRAVVAS
jgi:DUF1365 family protein